MTLSRRAFLTTPALAVGAAALARADEKRKPRVLLRSSWQTVNIGDIAHTPGALALLEKHIPDAEVRLWPSKVDNGVAELLKKRFPKVAIVQGADAVKTAIAECDFLLHGSGPSLVATNDVARWRKETTKPYGIYGITLATATDAVLDHITNAKFAFFRDSVSLKLVKEKGARCPVMDFGPDAAFAADLRNDEAAAAFLKANGLEEGKFLCCIPRLRYTPYWIIRNQKMTAEDDRKHAVNEKKKEQDHAPLRDAIVAVVRKAGLKVLVCPEDQSQMAVGKEMLVDQLPADVKKSVVWREKYWLTDEALSTYVRSAGLFGNEMHSPIMCVGNGVPAIVCRWAEQTSKGFMWRDIGLGEWLFDMDEEKDRGRVAETVLALASDPKGAKEKAAKARAFVRKRQTETMKALADELAKLKL
jgi:polysaccharide pyruvyl transferase WcaK-like protein